MGDAVTRVAPETNAPDQAPRQDSRGRQQAAGTVVWLALQRTAGNRAVGAMLDSNVGPAVGARAVVGIRIQRELDERRVRQATRWYRNRGSRLLRDLPESEWERVLGELGVDASSAEWTGEGGRRRLEVTEAFVRGVAAWQVGQRLGMEVDGVLGPTSMARLGIAVGRGDVTLNVADLQQGTADPALADFLDETTFAARLLDLVTGGGTSARTSDLRGRGETTVGLSGVVEGLEITPRSLLERLHGDHPDLVVGSFFTPPEGHDLDDVWPHWGWRLGRPRSTNWHHDRRWSNCGPCWSRPRPCVRS